MFAYTIKTVGFPKRAPTVISGHKPCNVYMYRDILSGCGGVVRKIKTDEVFPVEVGSGDLPKLVGIEHLDDKIVPCFVLFLRHTG